MPIARRAVSAVLNDFEKELRRLENFDTENQKKSSGRVSPSSLSKKQLYLLTEAIFFSGFRAYENFINDIFILYCMEKKTFSGKRINSYLKPQNFQHAENLLKSSMPFLDWSSPDTVINRSELYLSQGFPIKSAIALHLEPLRDFKRIRNHIAHNSTASFQEYQKVLRRHFAVTPLIPPSPGEFLLLSEMSGLPKYKLQTFFDTMKNIATLCAA